MLKNSFEISGKKEGLTVRYNCCFWLNVKDEVFFFSVLISILKNIKVKVKLLVHVKT